MTKRIAVAVLAVLASSTAYAAYPKSCMDYQLQERWTGEGEYVIEPAEGIVFTVYCKSTVHDAWPKDYLTLAVTWDPALGGEHNFGEYAEGATTVRTYYQRVRIDPSTLLVDIADMAFATSVGGPASYGGGVFSMPLGTAMDCAGPGSQSARANIDLTGTPFAIEDAFFTHGWYPAGSVAFDGKTLPLTPGGEVVVKRVKNVTITGGGYCGASGPAGFDSNLAFWPNSRGGILALGLKYVGAE